jgi:hypothetical protein
MKFGFNFSDLFKGKAKASFSVKKQRNVGNNVGIHGLQTVVLNKFEGFHPVEKCSKKVIGSNVVQRVGIWNKIVICEKKHNLLTDAGRDQIHSQVWIETNAANTERGAGFIALSENAGGAATGHTSVAAEITTNGLARADASTKTHTAGTNTSTLQHTFTVVTAGFSAVQLSGLLDASSSGNLINENTFTSTALAVGDQLQVTWTLTAG